VKLMVKVLAKSMDSSLAVDKVELATVTRDEATGKVRRSRTGATPPFLSCNACALSAYLRWLPLLALLVSRHAFPLWHRGPDLCW
jgi:hypothetical protein